MIKVTGYLLSMAGGKVYTIEPDERGFSLLYKGYALYKGLSYGAAANLIERFTRG